MVYHFGRFAAGPSWRFHVWSWQRCFATTDLAKWQRRCNRLMQLQGRISYPPLKSITVGDETYQLPLKAVDSAPQKPTQEELEYMAGFFDGDGCVAIVRKTGQISLKITQNVDSAGVLLFFRGRLGGGIRVQSHRTGKHKACLIWQLYGSKLRHAAGLLGQVPSMKQAQLVIGANIVAKAHQVEVVEQLAQFKQKNHRPNRLKCTWPYFAGFFDAEGSVSVDPLHVRVCLQVGQVNPFVLDHLLLFLHQNGFESWRLYHSDQYSTLCCSETTASKQTLDMLLRNGLIVKKKQAELALSLTHDNYREVRKAIMGLNGWQMRYNRLDEEGSHRAKEIKGLHNKKGRLSCTEKIQLQGKMQDLQAEHVFQKLVSKCLLLRKDIRNSLSEGAFVIPLRSQEKVHASKV